VYKLFIRPLLFQFSPEKAHHFTFNALKVLFKLPGVAGLVRAAFKYESSTLEREVFGIKFSNPVGLAAGFDKDARLIDELACLGFGFVEIGTLTPLPQPGNPKPRIFRLPKDNALVNRMGFNNEGVESAYHRLKKRRSKVIVGGNIGKNKVTPNDQAVADYEVAYDQLYDVVDYFVVNVSSPNTPNLRELQEKEPLTRLLQTLKERNLLKPNPKPILLKIAPDLTDSQLDDIIDIIVTVGIDGVIATNTTISREKLATDVRKVEAMGAGGLSGAVLKDRSTEVIRYLHQKSGGAFPIIGVGGIHSAQDAIEKLEAGASLVQVYTGFIYEGPALVKNIKKTIAETSLNLKHS
jgi:dihydroorotate dehydrogenase